ncbi:hypothetical protein FACS1894161_0930 [Spirochaetia bacterium]|nr:hypothetical protein FACS1894161_0930 [Spirochaetia bacterium]
MKKGGFVVMMLVCVLAFGMVMGCGDSDSGDNTDSTGGGSPTTYVVEAKYRGTWKNDSDPSYTFELTENERIGKVSGVELVRTSVWTVGTILYRGPVEGPIKDGTFTSDTTFSSDGAVYYTKQP